MVKTTVGKLAKGDWFHLSPNVPHTYNVVKTGVDVATVKVGSSFWYPSNSMEVYIDAP